MKGKLKGNLKPALDWEENLLWPVSPSLGPTAKRLGEIDRNRFVLSNRKGEMSFGKHIVAQNGDWREYGLLDGPRGICCFNDVVFICDLNHNRVRGVSVFNLDEVWDEIGCEDSKAPMVGNATEINFVKPRYIWEGLNGEFYLTSTDTCLVYEYKEGRVSVKAGQGRGWRDGLSENASFLNPRGGCVDPSTGDIYIADFGNDRVRVIDANGIVWSIGNGKRHLTDGSFQTGSFSDLSSTFYDNGHILVVQDGAVRTIDPIKKTIGTFAGCATTGFLDGPKMDALFSHLYDIKRGGSKLFISDHGNSSIRMIDENDMVSTLVHPDDPDFFSAPPFALTFLPQGHLMFTCSSRGKVKVFPHLLPSNLPISLQEMTNLPSSTSLTSSNPQPLHPSQNMVDIGSNILIQRVLIDLAYPHLHHSKIPSNFPDYHLSTDDIIYFLYSHHVPPNCDAYGALALITIVKACKLGSALKHAAYVCFSNSLRRSPPSFPSLFEYLEKSCGSDLEASKVALAALIKQKDSQHLFESIVSNVDSASYSDSLKSLSLDIQTRQTTLKTYNWKKGVIQSRLESLYWNLVFPSFPSDLAISEGANAQRAALLSKYIPKKWPETLQPKFRLMSSDGHQVVCHEWLLYARWPFFRLMMASGGSEALEGVLEMPKDPGFSILALKVFLYYLYTDQVAECDIDADANLEILKNAQFLGLMSNEWPSTAQPGFSFLISRCQTSLIRHPSIKSDCLHLLQLALEIGSSSHCITLKEMVVSEFGADSLAQLLDPPLWQRLESMKR